MNISINMEKTGENIKRSIKESKYTIHDIMTITGITTEQTIYKWYRGQSIPSLETQFILCKLLGLKITELLVLDGEFDFSGIANVEKYIEIAASLGLYVILRPSPYICAEWDFGGLPAWLLSDKNIIVRCSCPQYLEKVKNYYTVLIPRLAKYQCTNG